MVKRFIIIQCAALLLSFLLLPFPLTVIAAEENTTLKRSVSVDSKTNAKRWKVLTNEWRRYEEVMAGEGRYNWQNVDPIIVLGIYAETPSQRDRCAERVAIQEYEMNKRFLEFNDADLLAARRLYGKEPLMSLDKFNEFYGASISSPDKKISAVVIGRSVYLVYDTRLRWM